MSTDFERRPLTELLRATLTTVQVDSANLAVGVGSVPPSVGWRGEPNAPGTKFVPYVVLTTMTATPVADSGSLARPQDDWHLPYLIQSFGVRHDQAEWMADKARSALSGLLHEIVQCGTANYKVQQIWASQIGAVNRVPQEDPPYYGQQDGVTLWMARRKS